MKERLEQIKNKALYQDAEYEDVMELIEQIERYEELLKEIRHFALNQDVIQPYQVLGRINAEMGGEDEGMSEDKEKRSELIRKLGNDACDRNDSALKEMAKVDRLEQDIEEDEQRNND